MKPTIVLINFVFLFMGNSLFSQEIDIPKDTLYLDYSYYYDDCSHSDIKKKLKWKKRNGIQFNLCGKAIFIYPENEKSDTLAIKYLKNYNITYFDDLDSLISKWREKTKPLLIEKYGNPYPNTTNKNNMFVTYFIEKFKSHFIKYRVYWRNQRP